MEQHTVAFMKFKRNVKWLQSLEKFENNMDDK